MARDAGRRYVLVARLSSRLLLIENPVLELSEVKLSSSEHEFLKNKCPYLPEDYLDYLRSYRFRPRDQVRLSFHGGPPPKDAGDVSLDIQGKWVETILYEIPLLVLISETYFR